MEILFRVGKDPEARTVDFQDRKQGIVEFPAYSEDVQIKLEDGKDGAVFVSVWGEEQRQWVLKNVKKGAFCRSSGHLQVRHKDGKTFITFLARDIRFVSMGSRKSDKSSDQNTANQRNQQTSQNNQEAKAPDQGDVMSWLNDDENDSAVI